MMPLMTGPLRMRQHTAHGTSLAIIMVTAAVAAVSYAATEAISWHLVVALGCGAIAGAQVGARGAARVPAMRLRQLFGVFLVVVVGAPRRSIQAIDPLFAVSGVREAAAGACDRPRRWRRLRRTRRRWRRDLRARHWCSCSGWNSTRPRAFRCAWWSSPALRWARGRTTARARWTCARRAGSRRRRCRRAVAGAVVAARLERPVRCSGSSRRAPDGYWHPDVRDGDPRMRRAAGGPRGGRGPRRLTSAGERADELYDRGPRLHAVRACARRARTPCPAKARSRRGDASSARRPARTRTSRGRPFVGAAGQFLEELLAAAGSAPGRGLHLQRAEVPAAREPRPAAGRDRGLPRATSTSRSTSSTRW